MIATAIIVTSVIVGIINATMTSSCRYCSGFIAIIAIGTIVAIAPILLVLLQPSGHGAIPERQFPQVVGCEPFVYLDPSTFYQSNRRVSMKVYLGRRGCRIERVIALAFGAQLHSFRAGCREEPKGLHSAPQRGRPRGVG